MNVLRSNASRCIPEQTEARKLSNKRNKKFPNYVYWVFQDPNAPVQKIRIDQTIFVDQNGNAIPNNTVLTATAGETDVLTVDPQSNVSGAIQGRWSVPDTLGGEKKGHVFIPAGGIIIEN
jgi:hypothetical protein